MPNKKLLISQKKILLLINQANFNAENEEKEEEKGFFDFLYT